jgi:hypothetical protein
MNVLFYIMLVFLVVAPTVAIRNRNNAGAAVLTAVGIGALLMIRLSDASVFHSGVKAQMEREIKQAAATTQKLQKMAAIIAKENLDQLAMSRQTVMNIGTSEKFAIHDRIVNNLEDIGLPQEDIIKTQEMWIQVQCRMLFDRIESSIFEMMPDETAMEEVRGLPQDGDRQLPSPDTLRDWISSKSLRDDRLDQLVDEYTNVWTTGSMKNLALITSGSRGR